MTTGLQLTALFGFAGLMAAAAIEDIRRLVIPNPLVVALCALWPLRFATAADPSLATGLETIACAAAVFLAGAMIFARGLIGGGDVKLFSVASLWAGPGGLAPLLAVTGLLGGVLAILCLTPLGAWVGARRRCAPISAEAVAGAGSGTPVPYGAAIAAAAVIVTIAPCFG
jgi:prepilin peptidase CpaA